MQRYAATVPFRGKPDRAFGLAESVLTGLGFRLVDHTPEAMEWVGPGMNSTRQSPLVGASLLRFRLEGSELALEAELGGVARMARFVTLFPLGLCLVLAVVLSGVFAARFGQGPWMVPVVGSTGSIALVWLLLGPLLARTLRARTCRSLDTLLANMAAVGK